MVKGVSRQVLVVQSPGENLFDQAIFILRDDAEEISEEKLLQEAKSILRAPEHPRPVPLYFYGPVWAAGGALLTGIAWLLTAVIL